MPNEDDISTRMPTSRWLEVRLGSSGEGADDTHAVRIGDYEIIDELGSGGQGVVLRARKLSTGAEVALKLIRSDRLTPQAMTEFDREWKTLVQLKHPSIAKVIDHGWYRRGDCGAPYYVMELALRKNGRAALGLLEYCSKNNLTVEQKIALMVQVCGAIQAAHEKGVIHRDLKPGNIPVDELDKGHDTGLGVPKVIDFGLALIVSAAIIDPSTAAKPGDTPGTLRYMAPEQVRGETDNIGAWTDVHALGLIAFELLTGRLPYDLRGLTETQAIGRIETAPRAALVDVLPGSDLALSRILHRATLIDCTSEKGGRTRSARELQRELEDWLRRQHMRRTLSESVGRVATNWKWGWVAAGVVMATVVAQAGVSRVVESLNLLAPFEVWLSRMNPSWADVPFKTVRVVAVDEALNNQTTVDRLRKKLGITIDCPVDVAGSLRPLYMRVARQIAERKHACVVAVDILFELPTRFDDYAAADLAWALSLASESKASPIVVAKPQVANQSVETSIGPEGMCPAFAVLEPVCGTVSGVYENWLAWSVDMLVQRGGESPVPSLPVMLYANFLRPAVPVSFALARIDTPGVVNFGQTRHNVNGGDAPLPCMPLDVVEKDSTGDRLGLGVGDAANNLLLAIPGKAAREQSKVRFEDVADAADGSEEGNSKLDKWFDGKVVIIGDVRATRPDDPNPVPLTDMKRHPNGENIAGVYAMATATQWLIDGTYLRFPTELWRWVFTLFMGAAGALTVLWAVGRAHRRQAWACAALMVLGAAWVAATMLAYFFGMWYIGPWVPLCGMVMAGIGAGAVHGLASHGGAPTPRTRSKGATG